VKRNLESPFTLEAFRQLVKASFIGVVNGANAPQGLLNRTEANLAFLAAAVIIIILEFAGYRDIVFRESIAGGASSTEDLPATGVFRHLTPSSEGIGGCATRRAVSGAPAAAGSISPGAAHRRSLAPR